ncbi:hypothetical protein EGJ52_19890 [Pseudomonas luteola]|nr:hypothetical protein EGJ52_19890 [Pseudomonas luteola]
MHVPQRNIAQGLLFAGMSLKSSPHLIGFDVFEHNIAVGRWMPPKPARIIQQKPEQIIERLHRHITPSLLQLKAQL